MQHPFHICTHILTQKTTIMKQLITLTGTLLVITTATQAQITKGSFFIGGSISAGAEKTTSTFGNSHALRFLQVSPVFGKAIRDNLVLGGGVSFYTNNYGNIENDSRSTFGANIFLRKYKTLGKGFYLFGEAALNLGYTPYSMGFFNPTTNTFYTTETRRYSISADFSAGIAYQLSKRVQVELSLPLLAGVGFSQERYRSGLGSPTPYTTRKNNLYLNSNLGNSPLNNLSLGIRVFLGKQR
jgi:hypothetical protein